MYILKKYKKKNTDHNKCPFWRVVQFSRRVPLVVTFAIFIFTKVGFVRDQGDRTTVCKKNLYY